MKLDPAIVLADRIFVNIVLSYLNYELYES